MKIGMRIYFDSVNGDVLATVSERSGKVKPTSVEYEVSVFKTLSERNRETFDYIELEYGQYAQDFAESTGYRVNPETKELEFSYPDPNEPEAPPVYQKPLSEEVKALKIAQSETDETLLELLELTLLGGM